MTEYERLQKLSKEAIREVSSLNFPLGKVSSFTVSNTQGSWGDCSRTRDIKGEPFYKIRVSSMLLKAGSDTDVKGTIIHELIHTINGCFDHGSGFKMYAEKVNNAFPEYSIERANSTSSMKNRESLAVLKRAGANYVAKCSNCGAEAYYSKNCTVIKIIKENYACGNLSCRLCGLSNTFTLIKG